MLVIICMVLCGYCQKNVRPKMYLKWKDFVRGLGIFYLIYSITKIPQCPNCNFPMPRRAWVFAIQPTKYLVKLARISILQLTQFNDRIISASRMSYLNRKSDLSEHSASMNAYLTTSLYMTANEDSISSGLKGYTFRK
jgi:hypothetical protein